MEPYKEGCKHINLAANVCGYTPINLGKFIKDGILSDIPSIHRMTIDRAVDRKGGIRELTKMLNDVPHSYYDFVAGITTYCRKKPQRLEKVIKYMKSHPEADTSDIIEFVSEQEDFYEDTVRYNEPIDQR